MNFTPCRNCQFREVGCHESCGDYKKFRKNIDEAKKAKADWYGEHGYWPVKKHKRSSDEEFRHGRISRT